MSIFHKASNRYKIVELTEMIVVLEMEKRKEFSIHTMNEEMFLSFDDQQWCQFENHHPNLFTEHLSIDRDKFNVKKQFRSMKDNSTWLNIFKINND